MDTEFFKDLERLTLLVRKRVSTAYTGSRRSVRYGHGISPVGYREYRKGDDFKLVDWKVYARTEKLFVREHEEERSLIVHILLDGSKSMGLSGKFEFASKIAAGFAFLATQENEKFSVSLFDEELKPSEARRGKGYLLRTVEMLNAAIPSGKTDIRGACDQFEQMVRSTSLVVLISDFLDDIAQVESSIYRLSAHDLILVQVLSPKEMRLDLAGDIRFIDMETEEHLVTRITQRLKDDYSTRLKDHNTRIGGAANAVKADFFSFSTEYPILDAFKEITQRAGAWRF